jgi:peptidoglycan hydrolase CwlO-like protein
MIDDANANTKPEVDVEALDATQNIIIRLSDQLDELKKQQKELGNMVKSVFDNDEKFQTAQSTATEATKEAKSRKEEINGTGEIKELHLKIADLKEDLKMVEESLNTHLINYFQMTGSTSVDQPDGTERQFKVTARMKPKKQDAD